MGSGPVFDEARFLPRPHFDVAGVGPAVASAGALVDADLGPEHGRVPEDEGESGRVLDGERMDLGPVVRPLREVPLEAFVFDVLDALGVELDLRLVRLGS